MDKSPHFPIQLTGITFVIDGTLAQSKSGGYPIVGSLIPIHCEVPSTMGRKMTG